MALALELQPRGYISVSGFDLAVLV